MSDNGENGDKVTADTYGNLQVDEADKECWMLRVPPKLAEAWEQVPEGTVLGELVFRKGQKAGGGRPAIKPSLQVQVAPDIAQTDDHKSTSALPLQYSLQAMTKREKLPTLHPFTRRSNGSVQVHGTVTRTANLQVQQDANYRKLCKTRILQTTVHNQRYVKPVEANQVVQQSNSSGKGKGFGEAIHQYGKRILEQANQPLGANKQARFSDDQPTKSVLFQLFSQQRYWTFKDLKYASGGRPETEIRDVLREIGDYHRVGDHKQTWELRKEFQNTQNTTGANTSSTGNTGDSSKSSNANA